MAAISASASVSLDTHTEYTKNAVDSEHSIGVEAAKKNIVLCRKHDGFWVSRPKNGLMGGTEVRDCPACVAEASGKSTSQVNDSLFLQIIE